jgi:hypothetical protein
MGDLFTRGWYDRVEALLALALRRQGGGGSGMTIARAVDNVIGASEVGSGITIADTVSLDSAQQDVLGDNKSVASLNLFVDFTSAVTGTGTVDVSILPILNDAGVVYADAAPLVASYVPTGATFSACVNLPAARLPAARFFKVRVLNNGTGADITDVYVGIEVTKTT